MAPPPAEPQVDARAGAHREVTATLRWDAASVAELEGVPGVSQGARGFRDLCMVNGVMSVQVLAEKHVPHNDDMIF